jgi:hypothetical protein
MKICFFSLENYLIILLVLNFLQHFSKIYDTNQRKILKK